MLKDKALDKLSLLEELKGIFKHVSNKMILLLESWIFPHSNKLYKIIKKEYISKNYKCLKCALFFHQ